VSAAERPHSPAADGELAESVRVLTDRIEALQADVRRLGGSAALPSTDPGWDDRGSDVEAAAPSYAWVGALEPRIRRRPAVPRVLLESMFLIAVALGCALAELDGPVIAAVMAGAWVLVALIEWTSARADARRDDIVVTFAEPEQAPPDPSWLVPPVERTLHDAAAGGDATQITRLPAAPSDELEQTAAGFYDETDAPAP
jgi:hypothetical protein